MVEICRRSFHNRSFNKYIFSLSFTVYNKALLLKEEREVLLSIYDGDEQFTLINDTTFTYRVYLALELHNI